jgi:hypothetical protein
MFGVAEEELHDLNSTQLQLSNGLCAGFERTGTVLVPSHLCNQPTPSLRPSVSSLGSIEYHQETARQSYWSQTLTITSNTHPGNALQLHVTPKHAVKNSKTHFRATSSSPLNSAKQAILYSYLTVHPSGRSG